MQPKAAPMAKEGTISPPFNPAPKVRAVKNSLSTKSRGWLSPRLMAAAMMPSPVPKYNLVPRSRVSTTTTLPPANTRR